MREDPFVTSVSTESASSAQTTQAVIQTNVSSPVSRRSQVARVHARPHMDDLQVLTIYVLHARVLVSLVTKVVYLTILIVSLVIVLTTN